MRTIVKMAAVAILVAGSAATALAQEPGGRTLGVQGTCFYRIPALARRLHVRPAVGAGLLVVDGCDGHSYDILSMIDALVARMDRVERQMQRE